MLELEDLADVLEYSTLGGKLGPSAGHQLHITILYVLDLLEYVLVTKYI